MIIIRITCRALSHTVFRAATLLPHSASHKSLHNKQTNVRTAKGQQRRQRQRQSQKRALNKYVRIFNKTQYHRLVMDFKYFTCFFTCFISNLMLAIDFPFSVYPARQGKRPRGGRLGLCMCGQQVGGGMTEHD